MLINLDSANYNFSEKTSEKMASLWADTKPNPIWATVSLEQIS